MNSFRCFFVGVLCVAISFANTTVSFATKGPCTTVHETSYNGAIGCDVSGCVLLFHTT
jgi:hypothetical protein